MSSNWARFLQQQEANNRVSKNDRQPGKKPTATTKHASVADIKPDIWFDNVDEALLKSIRDQSLTGKGRAGSDGMESAGSSVQAGIETLAAKPYCPSSTSIKIGKYVAIDCEMVGVGPEGKESALARVSLVNFHGHVILDKYCKPKEKVTDYRTHVSGILPHHLENAETFEEVQKQVADILKDRIIIGHDIKHDFSALLLSHPVSMIRDTSKFKAFRKLAKGRTPSLKKLTKEVLKRSIQEEHHSSVDDARATMDLYKSVRNEWEAIISRIHRRRSLPKKITSSIDHN